MWHDVHSHPQQLPSPEEALRRAIDAGVSCVVAATEKPSEAAGVLALMEEFPDALRLAAGLHPATASLEGPENARRELDLLPSFLERAFAVGEIGLDYKYATSREEKEFQKEILREQFSLAAEYRLPVQLHSRRAQRQTMEAAIEFSEKTGLPVLLHWFTASKKLIRITNEKGIFVSVGPSVLFDEATRKVVSTIRPDLLLLETDCPVPIGGEPNEPAKAARVAEEVARIFGFPLPELSDRLERNLAAYGGRT